jgi:hypothetical protein
MDVDKAGARVTCLSGSDRHLSLPGGMVRGTSTVQPSNGLAGTRRLRDRPGEYGARQPGCGRALSTLQPLGTLLTQTDGVQNAKPFQRLMAGLGAGRRGRR